MYADNYYVQGSVGDDGNDGDAWGSGSALATIGQGITLANANTGADTIHVAAGTYEEHLVLGSDITLYGGYPAAGGASRNRTANPTYIDGTGTGRPVTIMNVSNVTLDGFVVQNGVGNRGGGILIQSSLLLVTMSVTINDNEITNNPSPGSWGGGIAVAVEGEEITIETIDVTITNNDITGNSTPGSGGGISFWQNCTGDVSGNTISNNTAVDSGGGIIVSACGTGSGININNNTISNNQATGTGWSLGGGIMVGSNSSCVIDENTIESNTAEDVGGGVCVSASGATISNNTIKSNESATDWGGGIGLYDAGGVSITGNLITQNTAPAGNGYGGGISFCAL